MVAVVVVVDSNHHDIGVEIYHTTRPDPTKEVISALPPIMIMTNRKAVNGSEAITTPSVFGLDVINVYLAISV